MAKHNVTFIVLVLLAFSCMGHPLWKITIFSKKAIADGGAGRRLVPTIEKPLGRSLPGKAAGFLPATGGRIA
jgi:hypothetical protein